MNRKKVEPDAMESSSSEGDEEEEEEDAENEEEESASESSSGDDEFDSSDDRVNMVPNETPSETFKSFAQEESSEESASDEDEETMKPAEAEKSHGIKKFESDVESEYETDSGSESEGLTQKTVVKESSIEAEDGLPLTQKKAKKDDSSVDQGRGENDHSKTGKTKVLKQQQDTKPTKINEEANPLAMKGQGGVVKQMLKDNEQSRSAKDEKKQALSAKKRKLESTRPDGETDSVDSVPIVKRKKDVEFAENGKANGVRGKIAHSLGDIGKEIAKKTLSDPSAKLNGSKDTSSKVSAVEHEPRQLKKARTDASNGPSSPEKQKKAPHVWSAEEEITMSSEVLNRVRMGLEVPSKRNDEFWSILSEVLHKEWDVEFSRDQLSEKLRRMKLRYQSQAQKIKETHDLQKPYKHKSDKEQDLFNIWSQIWGRAEVITLEDHQVASDTKKEPSKELGVSASFVKETRIPSDAQKIKPASKAKASKESAMAAVENNTGRDALPPTEESPLMPMEVEAAKGKSPALDESTSLSKDMHNALQRKIHETLDELQKWSKNNMEAWMSKALALVENSMQTLADQARCANAVGIAGGGAPLGLCNSTELRFMHGEEAFQQQWYELHLQELNIYSQRLELMQKECKLKQEQLKLQLQVERGK